MRVFFISHLVFLVTVLLPIIHPTATKVSFAAEHPEESITYWKPFEILPSEDPKVKVAEEIFRRLLLGWEEARIAPQLHIVRSDKGPWAASLDDGTILLSREAIDICWQNDPKSGPDRLAFVLAHELSHQRVDHLWHRQFFRLAGKQPPKVKGKMLGEMTMNQLEGKDLEAKEIQADREGLLLMAMVGYSPQRIISDGGHFFFEWIESIWGESCDDGSERSECEKAQSRYERVGAHWRDVTRQSVLFDLGVHSYVAANYILARKYFTAYGRQFPGREIHNNIGLTHIGEAMILRKRLLANGENLGPEFVYPTVLEEAPRIQKERPSDRRSTRGEIDSSAVRWRKEMEGHLSEAALSFERAVKIDPSYRPSYWNLISSYLMAGNGALAYGVTAGNYARRFDQDATAVMLLGISATFEGDPKKAGLLFDQAVRGAGKELELLARMNRAAFLRASGDSIREQAEWKKLADFGRKVGDEGLFRLALERMGKRIGSIPPPDTGKVEKINGYAIGQRVPPLPADSIGSTREEVWLEGERIELYFLRNGVRIAIDANRYIIALWQSSSEDQTELGISIGDDAARVGRAYGIPSRRIRTIQGNFQAYDEHHIALLFIDNKVAGWFLYDNQP